MSDPVVHITAGVPDSGTGNITTLGQTLADGANATLGVTTGAAVTTDATGTIQQYLRGLIKQWAAGTLGVVLGAETTKVIGVTRTADGSGNLLTATANALDINVKSGVNANGQATKANSAPVVPASDWVYNTGKYVAVAASQTDAVIQASAGAAGDYLDHMVVIPATTAPGVVTIKDNATALISYPGGGTTALLTLTPFTIYVGAVSSSGAWKVTTGANVSILAVGRFS
jgi:hypothetical protein